MHHCKLLIVDDDSLWLRIAAQYFSIHKYKVYTAESCSAGLKSFDLHKPDCVLLDYNLQDADAEAFCREVRAEEKITRTPIVVISGEEVREMQAYTVCKADGFVLKGETPDKAKAVVEMVMRRVNWDRGIIKAGDIRLERTNFQVFRYSRPVVTLSPDQFHLFYLLIQESPGFVSEDEISKYLYESDFAPQNAESIRGIMQRLRKKLGIQLGRRIKNKSRLGWTYAQPRLYPKATAPTAKESNSQRIPNK